MTHSSLGTGKSRASLRSIGAACAAQSMPTSTHCFLPSTFRPPRFASGTSATGFATSRKLVLKAVLNVADAVMAADIGVDGIVVSNHGGRQLDLAGRRAEVLRDADYRPA